MSFALELSEEVSAQFGAMPARTLGAIAVHLQHIQAACEAWPPTDARWQELGRLQGPGPALHFLASDCHVAVVVDQDARRVRVETVHPA